jgi:dihydropteroate synthase
MRRAYYPAPVLLGSAGAAPANTNRAWLGGCAEQAFEAVDVIARGGDAGTRIVRRMPVAELRAGPSGLSALLEALTRPRAPLAGLDLARPRIMGIVNVTPDSFSDGGRHPGGEAAIAHGLALVGAGADVLDIGGESTRPGAQIVPVELELSRVLPVIEGLRRATPVPLSIDTRKAPVMAAAVAAGAAIVNDVSALSFDADAAATVARLGVPVVLMHARGDPTTMQRDPRYDDVTLDVFDYLASRVGVALAAGIARDRLVVDPGIGFGKTLAHNVQLLRELRVFAGLGVPVLLGASRKRFIGTLSGVEAADERVAGSLAAALMGLAQGVEIVRVHDVAATRQAFAVWQAIQVQG